MKFSLVRLLGTVLLLLCAGVVHGAIIDPDLRSALASAAPGESVPVIVTFDAPETVATLAQQAAVQGPSGVVRTLRNRADRSQGGVRALLQGRSKNFRPLWIINAMATEADLELIQTLANQPGVKEVRLDRLLQRPEVRPAQVGGTFWNLGAVRAPDLWNQNITGVGTTVAFFDSGVDINQPLLGPKWRGGPRDWFNPYADACSAPGAQCTPCEANGLTPCDDAAGLDFGHGTAVAGIVLGGDVTTTTGVAPGANWIAAKIFRDDDTAPISAIHAAFQWALDPDGVPSTPDAPAVVNNSWGFEGAENQCLPDFRPDVQALRAAGIAVVFAGGNGGPGSATSISPGNYPEDHAVGALEPDLSLALFSARGPSACDGGIYPGATAPGVDIHTTALGTGLTTVSGTSFSAPHLSGVLALLRQAAPAVPMADLATAALRSASDLGPQGADNGFGFGLVDALAALRRVQGAPHMGVHDPVPPENDGHISYGPVFPGLTVAKILTVYNQGGGPLNVQVSPLGGATPQAFAVTENTCAGASLPPEGICTLAVAFTPPALGSFSGRVTLTPSSVQSPLEVILEGIGRNVPTAAQLISPADGSQTGTSVTFRWLPGSNPDGQPVTDELMVSRDRNFVSRVAGTAVPQGSALLAGAGGLLAAFAIFRLQSRRRTAALLTALLLVILAACGGGSSGGDDEPGVAQTVSGLTPGTYFWKVTSRNPAGGTSDSEVRSFTVQ